jgi:hypothetical protein
MRRAPTVSEVIVMRNTFKLDRYLRQRAVRFMRRKHAGWGNRSFRKFVNNVYIFASGRLIINDVATPGTIVWWTAPTKPNEFSFI